jgi:3-oxoacyl-[acyl-carrier-protein] synthase II
VSTRRGVITGVGGLSPLANNAEDNWQAILAGKNGTTQIEHFDTTGFSTTICGVVKDFDASTGMSQKDA